MRGASTRAWSTPASRAHAPGTSRCVREQLKVGDHRCRSHGDELAAELSPHRHAKLSAHGLDRIDPDKDLRSA